MSNAIDQLNIFQAARKTPLRPKEWQKKLAEVDWQSHRDWEWEAERYVADPFVVEAVNVAIALGKPLLVTGDPGVGKTALANALAWQLGLEKPEKFVAKSTSVASDLFYRYDALARFHAIEVAHHLTKEQRDAGDQPRRFLEPENARYFVDYNGLGRAILSAHKRDDIADFLLPTDAEGTYLHPGTPKRSVVLIDEIDKASSDFCNDLLDEFDKLHFEVPEIRTAATPELSRQMRPIVIITSNRERELPPAFLRRCVYAHIPQPLRGPGTSRPGPDEYRIENIMRLRVDDNAVYSQFTTSLLDLVDEIRRRKPAKAPSTAEIIELIIMCDMKKVDWSQRLEDLPHLHDIAVATLAKTESDNGITAAALQALIERKSAGPTNMRPVGSRIGTQ